jgi:hypothetical protein
VSQGEHEHFVFVLARPSGAGAAKTSSLEAMSRRVVESAWAAKHGIQLDQIREMSSGTETTTHSNTPTATICGTETQDGSDITTDHSSDSSDDEGPDIHTDNP